MTNLPEYEVRKMLGDNAIEFYGLDKDYLDGIARRVGPLPVTILGAPEVRRPRGPRRRQKLMVAKEPVRSAT